MGLPGVLVMGRWAPRRWLGAGSGHQRAPEAFLSTAPPPAAMAALLGTRRSCSPPESAGFYPFVQGALGIRFSSCKRRNTAYSSMWSC